MANVLHNTCEDMQNQSEYYKKESNNQKNTDNSNIKHENIENWNNQCKSKNDYAKIIVPSTIEEKKAMLHKHHIALWDAIYSCDIIGSSDSSIKNVVPTDLKPILEQSKITKVFCNGATSSKYYKKYQEKVLGIEAVTLPSTSPANAAYSLDRLIEIWTDHIKQGLQCLT